MLTFVIDHTCITFVIGSPLMPNLSGDPLQSLAGLPSYYATDAPFNSLAKQHEPTCLSNTRVDVLREIYSWADRQDEQCIFWLYGLAGTGKSTIARTVARKYSGGRLGASFFFSRGGGDVSHAGKFVMTVTVQLATNVPPLKQHIYEAISNDITIVSQDLRDQWRQIVLAPLSKLTNDSCPSSYVLVVDALDECDDDKSIRIILELLAEARSLKTVRLRIFITSRPEIAIRQSVHQLPEAELQSFALHNISAATVDQDISLFFTHYLTLIGQENSLKAGWPGEQAIGCLVRKASGLFIWATTACRFIREGLFVEERLRILLEGRISTAAPEEHLNGLYITVLQNSIRPGYTEQEKQGLCSMLRDILGSIVVLFSPLSADSLSRLPHLTKRKVNQVLKDLHAILDIPKNQSDPLRLHHPSFRDFLLDEDRCGDPKFWVDEKQAHRTLADSCIQLMSASLKQDICSVGAPGMLVTDIERSRVEQCLLPEVQYACVHWVQHLQKGDIQLHDNSQVHEFLQKHLLHWLESMNLIGETSESIRTLISLESHIPVSHHIMH
jgi:hypothetical protein